MAERAKIPGSARRLSREQQFRLNYLRKHPELWDEPLKNVVKELKRVRLIARGTWWEDCTSIPLLIQLLKHPRVQPVRPRCPTCGRALRLPGADAQDLAVSLCPDTNTPPTDASILPG